MASTGQAALPLGLTLDELYDAAKHAAFIGRRYGPLMSLQERTEYVEAALIDHAYTCTTHDRCDNWTSIGFIALRKHIQRELRVHGIDATNGPARPTPRYIAYWSSADTYQYSPEDLVVDPTALRQIWPELTSGERAVLDAQATHDGDQQAASQALRITLTRYHDKLSDARRHFYRLWHEHEAPAAFWKRSHPKTRRRHRTKAEHRVDDHDLVPVR
jgi:hypothetical protein